MENKRYKSYEIPAIGGTQHVNLSSNEETIVLYGTATLTSSYTLAPAPTSTPVEGMTMNVLYVANVTLGVNDVTIFGNSLTADEALSNIEIRLFYDGSTWQIVKKIHNDDLVITVDDIGDGELNGSVLIDGTVAVGKLTMTGENKILKGDGAGSSEELAIAVNNLVTNYSGVMVSRPVAGALTAVVSAGAIEFSLVDDIVGMANMDDITRGSIIRGGVGNNPELHDVKTNGHVLAGTGTDVKSLEVSGDASAEYDSVNDKLKLTVNNVSGINAIPIDNTAYGTVKRYFYTDLQAMGLLDGNENIVHELGQGDLLVDVSLYVSSGATVGTLDVDTKLSSTYDSMISAGDLTITGKIETTNTDITNAGYFPIVVPGNVVVQSSTSVTDGNVNLVIDVIEVSNNPYA
jgi:hypothetical protein